MQDYICCICGKKFHGWGNDPWPVVKEDDALCCDKCNSEFVIPERIAGMIRAKTEKCVIDEHAEDYKNDVGESGETV